MKRGKKHKPNTQKRVAQQSAPTIENKRINKNAPTAKKLIIALGVIIILVVLVLWLLGGKGESNMNQTLLAKVNGEPVYESEVDKLVLQAQQQGFPFTKEQITEQVISRKVLLQEAKKQGITIETTEVDKYIKNLENLVGQPINALLQKLNLTEDEFRTQITEQLILTQLLAQLKPKEAVTDEEIKAFYAENEEAMIAPEQVHASHILVKTEEEAKAILADLKSGEDFAALAKEKSIDPSAKTNGGDLGFFGKGQMVKEFEDVAFSLKKGDLSAPVKSQFGYHIIKLLDKRESGKLSLEKAKEDIRGAIQEQKTKEATDAYVKDLITRATIERMDKN